MTCYVGALIRSEASLSLCSISQAIFELSTLMPQLPKSIGFLGFSCSPRSPQPKFLIGVHLMPGFLNHILKNSVSVGDWQPRSFCSIDWIMADAAETSNRFPGAPSDSVKFM